MSAPTFTAQSLQDIADHFRSISQSHADRAGQAKSAKLLTSHMAHAAAWNGAADFLDNCELAPTLAVIS